MDRLETGFALLGLAPVAWLVMLFFGGDEGYGIPLAIILVGMGLAAWAVPTERRIAGAVGLVVAAFGMAVFYNFSFANDLGSFAGFVYAAACLAGTFAVLSGMRLAQAICYFALGFAGVCWVLFDGTAAITWQPGNVLSLVGGVLAGLGALRDR